MMKKVLYVLRHLLSIAVLPFVVAVVVPAWISRRSYTVIRVATKPADAGVQLAGVLVILAGVALFAASLSRFVRDGRGTLAPWDPPREFVVSGPYRYVRNPMISGVILILLGEAMGLRSVAHLEWAGAFFAMNAVYIPLFEERQLAARFGEQYERYCRHVRRLVPRLRPWTPRQGRSPSSTLPPLRGGPKKR